MVAMQVKTPCIGVCRLGCGLVRKETPAAEKRKHLQRKKKVAAVNLPPVTHFPARDEVEITVLKIAFSKYKYNSDLHFITLLFE